MLRKTLSTITDNIEVRVRFAPSPTGNVHLGGLRTALYNYIFAKQNHGKFVLRIEDTDQKRLVPGSADHIENTLEWAGLNPDEGPTLGGPYGPYEQSKRLGIYQDHVQELIRNGSAYRCFCSQERLDLLKKHQRKAREPIGYDRKCRHLTANQIDKKLVETGGVYAVRFAMRSQITSFEDRVFGLISNDFTNTADSDPVLMKSDKYPTYHFANVVDDHLMEISHVIRGSEWITSTCKHIQIYESFGWDRPEFMHLPLIIMKDGSKMSKRNGKSNVDMWRHSGYDPLALLNFLTNVGGGVPKSKQDNMDFWTLERIVEEFDFGKLVNNSGRLDTERIDIYNRKSLIRTYDLNPSEAVIRVRQLLDKSDKNSQITDAEILRILELLSHRIVTFNELLATDYKFIWQEPSFEDLTYAHVAGSLLDILEDIGLEDRPKLLKALEQLACDQNVDHRTLMRYIRKFLTGCDKGLPVYEIFLILGQKRLKIYLNKLKSLV